jgi:hypothetical protein
VARSTAREHPEKTRRNGHTTAPIERQVIQIVCVHIAIPSEIILGPTLISLMIALAGVLRGLNTPPDQLPKLD